jgi:glyoxylase-like metal-dependent hydrolase (beta-lactamase superfamily II)
MNSVLEVADRWFHLEYAGDGIALICEPDVDEFIRCNIWHVRGRDRDLLVDSGMGVRSLRAEIPRLSERPVLCVATDCHFDHWRGLHEFDQRLGHSLEAEIYAAPTGRTTVADKYISDRSFSRLPYAGYEPLKYAVRPAPLTRQVGDGDVIDLGDRILSVVPEEYLETMHRLRELPVDIVHGGHCPSFGRARMMELIDECLAGKRRAGRPNEA